MKTKSKKAQTQFLFDTVISHLIKQGRPSEATTEMGQICAYRGKNGTSCAVGCLIADEFYSYSYENKSISYSPVRRAVEDSLCIHLTPIDLALLEDLQKLHDTERNFDSEEFFERVLLIASAYKLNAKVLRRKST